MQRRNSLTTYYVAHRIDREVAELGLENGRPGRGSQWGCHWYCPPPEPGFGHQHHHQYDNHKPCRWWSPSKAPIRTIQLAQPRSRIDTVAKGWSEVSFGNLNLLESLFPNKKRVWVPGSPKYGKCPLKIVTWWLCPFEFPYSMPFACGKSLLKVRYSWASVSERGQTS